ncbi:alanine--glyoxylate aminotransferase family protein [Maribrevibacterium harenarium]|uniref:Alanine--glyoxylate aminotransferase family protein n=1 Tax=Maribrevibacterium harenarium TaxID=2589817 RepID=A0A501WZV9_9GAMM|nr:alanine--glyoxylate aminotransferase family protein [Maribrevibacterium harenarium]TPE53377.1 alanine--glyoxylate aminotransferase family protein [Maribrevibacterium harenarium]
MQPLTLPPRLLMGPGPINCYPRVLQAMATQLVGQYDPAMTDYMNETMALYRRVFNTQNQQTFLIDGTSRAGIEAALVSVLEPGDKVLVPIFGRFGYLLAEIAERADADVHTIEVPWGEVFAPEQIEEAIKRIRPKVLAIVQGDTSTTMLQPLDALGAICREYDVLFYTDATASIGGNPFETDKWQVDAVTVGLQKCLGGPSGSAPISMSDRFVQAVRRRHHVEAGIRDSHHTGAKGARIRSNYFDLAMIMDYWGDERLNHHTEAATMLFGSRECAVALLSEGQDDVLARHQTAGLAMLRGIQALGLTPFGDLKHKMSNVVGVYIPDGVDGEQVRHDLLHLFNIEIGTSFGPLKGKIWRIGTMGYNARQDAVLHTLQSLETVLRRQGFSMPAGAGVDAAMAVYAGQAQG